MNNVRYTILYSNYNLYNFSKISSDIYREVFGPGEYVIPQLLQNSIYDDHYNYGVDYYGIHYYDDYEKGYYDDYEDY